MHSMLWHADIQNITVDVTFRRKATGVGINSKNKTNDHSDPKKVEQMIQKEPSQTLGLRLIQFATCLKKDGIVSNI